MDSNHIALVVGIGQLLFHVFRTWHIKSIAANSSMRVLISCVAYQATVISTYALGIDAFLSKDWTVVIAFIVGGALGSAGATLRKRT